MMKSDYERLVSTRDMLSSVANRNVQSFGPGSAPNGDVGGLYPKARHSGEDRKEHIKNGSDTCMSTANMVKPPR
jgi:hypothetical protein